VYFDFFYCRSLILSYVYIFCYINVEDSNTKIRMVFFYIMTFVENILLVVLWTLSVKASLDYDHVGKVKKVSSKTHYQRIIFFRSKDAIS